MIGAKTQFKGEITGSEPVLVEGLVEGTIRITGPPPGRPRRDGEGHRLRPVRGGGGELVGDCHAADRVEIEAAGRLTGNIRAPRVVIVEGATFRGHQRHVAPHATARRPEARPMAPTYANYIDGQWVPAASGRTFENRNPADTSDLVGIFADSGPEDVERAVAAAREAFPRWKALPAPKRGEILYRAAEILVRRKEEFSRDMTREMGKVLDETRGDVQEAIDMTYYMAGEGRRQFGQTTPSEMPRQVPDVGAPAGGHRRPHHALELPDGDPLLEDDAGAHPREHRRHQAGHRHSRCRSSTC